MKIAFLDSNLKSLCAAHQILDNLNCQIHFFSINAEIGLFDESPGIISKWPLLPLSWKTSLYSQEPNNNFNAVRRSWFEKSIAISLAKRGTIFHLKTRIIEENNDFVKFIGGGIISSGKIHFDKIFRNKRNPEHNTWYGGITTKGTLKMNNYIIGRRADSTIEVWSKDKLPSHNHWIQQMVWQGKDPKTSIDSEIEIGTQTATNFLTKTDAN
jgi:hypothetical protein